MIDSCKYSVDKIKERKLSINDYLFHTYSDQKTQYNVLKEMRNKYVLAIKFFTETKNEEQLTIAYKEIEAFTETYNNFCFYYFFDPENINPKYLNLLSDQKRNLLKDEDILKYLNDYKMRTADDIFGNGNYNFPLYKYALEKICEEERKEREKEEEILRASQPQISFFERVKNSNFYLIASVGIILFTVGLVISQYVFYSKGPQRVFSGNK